MHIVEFGGELELLTSSRIRNAERFGDLALAAVDGSGGERWPCAATIALAGACDGTTHLAPSPEAKAAQLSCPTPARKCLGDQPVAPGPTSLARCADGLPPTMMIEESSTSDNGAAVLPGGMGCGLSLTSEPNGTSAMV